MLPPFYTVYSRIVLIPLIFSYKEPKTSLKRQPESIFAWNSHSRRIKVHAKSHVAAVKQFEYYVHQGSSRDFDGTAFTQRNGQKTRAFVISDFIGGTSREQAF